VTAAAPPSAATSLKSVKRSTTCPAICVCVCVCV
jgi:hypothetical protein